ncbi:hypothetical protein CRYUN_Cryun21dG0106100 [Craigia yunnanensis]
MGGAQGWYRGKHMGILNAFVFRLGLGEVGISSVFVFGLGLGENLNCLKRDSSSTIEDSHFSKENLAGVVSSDKMLMDDSEVAKANVESPCNAQNLEVLEQTLSTVSDKCESCDYDEVTQNSNNESKQFEIEGMPKATICHSFEVQNLNSVNPSV